MANLDTINAHYLSKFPVGEQPAKFPDLCSILSPQQDISATTAFGHSRAGDPVTVASSVRCRIVPQLGRFNRIEDVFHSQVVTADFIVYMEFQDDIKEGYYLKITSSDNSRWTNMELDIILEMDASGHHGVHMVACNKKKEN